MQSVSTKKRAVKESMPGNEILKLFEQDDADDARPKARKEVMLNFRKQFAMTSTEEYEPRPEDKDELLGARLRIQEAFRAKRRWDKSQG